MSQVPAGELGVRVGTQVLLASYTLRVRFPMAPPGTKKSRKALFCSRQLLNNSILSPRLLNLKPPFGTLGLLQYLQPRQLNPAHQLHTGSATGRHPLELIVQAGLIHKGRRVAATNDAVGAGINNVIG